MRFAYILIAIVVVVAAVIALRRGRGGAVAAAIKEAEFHLSYGLKDQAREVIDRALELHPGEPELAAMRRRVGE